MVASSENSCSVRCATQAPSAGSSEPAPQARPATAPGRTAQRWWREPATAARSAPPSAELLSGRMDCTEALARLFGATPCSPVCSHAASAAAECKRLGLDKPACRQVSVDLRLILISMVRAVLLTALCGVCSAYQAATARTGALASQVTMMAKSKARPRSPCPQHRAALCQASESAAHTEMRRPSGRADVRCA